MSDGDVKYESARLDLEQRLELAREKDSEFDSLWSGDPEVYENDGQEAIEMEKDLSRCLAHWFGVDDTGSRIKNLRWLVWKILNHSKAPKWNSNPDDEYRRSVLEAVDDVERFYNPVYDGVEITELDGCYGYWKGEGDSRQFEPVTNFTLETRSVVRHVEDGTVKFKLTVHPKDETKRSYRVEVEPKRFNRSRDFTNNVVTGPSTRFDGGKQARNDIREVVAAQTDKNLRGTNRMGLHGDDEFVTPAGTISSEGWSDSPDTVYIERGVDPENRWSVEPSGNYENKENHARVFVKTAPVMRDSERLYPTLGWIYAAPLKPFFLDQIGEFPIMSVTGDTGSGKTSTLQILWQAFGMDETPFGVGLPSHAQLTIFSSSCSVPMCFDEYRPTSMSSRKVDAFHDYCRKSTRGGSESKGNPDGSTDTYRIEAPVVVSGEQRFQDPSLLRRSLVTNFTVDAVEDVDKRREYSVLAGESYEDEDGQLHHPEGIDLGAHAYHYYSWLSDQDMQQLEERWHKCQETVKGILSDEGISLGNVRRESVEVVLFGLRLCQVFANSLGTEAPFDAFSVDEDVRDALVYAATNSGGNREERGTHLSEFVEMIARAAMEGYLQEGEHYTFTHSYSTLRVNLSRCYDQVRRYHMDHNLDSDIFGKGEYRDRIQDKLDDTDSFIEAVDQNTPPIGRAFGVHVDSLPENIDFSLDMFDEPSGGRPHVGGEKI